jgi:hypothetical protein
MIAAIKPVTVIGLYVSFQPESKIIGVCHEKALFEAVCGNCWQHACGFHCERRRHPC